jgi:hypothetical protein
LRGGRRGRERKGGERRGRQGRDEGRRKLSFFLQRLIFFLRATVRPFNASEARTSETVQIPKRYEFLFCFQVSRIWRENSKE